MAKILKLRKKSVAPVDETLDQTIKRFQTLHGFAPVFIIEAIAKYSEQVIDKADVLRHDLKDTMLSADGWIDCAKVLNESIIGRFGK